MSTFSLLLQRGLGFIVGGPPVGAVSREQKGKAASTPVDGQGSRPAASPVEVQEEGSRLSGLLTSPILRDREIADPASFPFSPLGESMDLYQAKLFSGSAILILTLRVFQPLRNKSWVSSP